MRRESEGDLKMSKIEDFIIENNTLVQYTGNDEHVEIPNGIEAVDNVFRFFKNIKSVFIPESVIDIAYDISYSCCGLEQITVDINNKVYDSRNNCNALIETKSNKLILGCKNTVIPDTVSTIEKLAFTKIDIVRITIPKSVKKIGKYAFTDCKDLTGITVDKNNKVFDSRNNCNAIIETATNKLLFGCKNTVIPDDVEIIGDYAFSGITALKTIAIPDGIKKIGKCAFEGCRNLTELTIPESVISIAPWSFEECPDLVIKGSKNSYAHKYAVNNNIRFETI